VLEAARAALRPPGLVRWIAEPVGDRVDLRLALRRWSTGVETSARLARISCGTALRAARLAVAMQGRHPVVTHPKQLGLLAVLRAGDVEAPRREEALLYALLCGGFALPLIQKPSRTAALQRLRRAAEAEGAWLRVLPKARAPSRALGPCWHEPADPAWTEFSGDPIAAVIGAAGPAAAADLRVGQAVEAVRLTAAALGLVVRVPAAPAAPGAVDARLHAASAGDALAVVQVWWPVVWRPEVTATASDVGGLGEHLSRPSGGGVSAG
jgi:hypothetical protein